MMKKFGMIAAAATAGLIALSPIAFATTPSADESQVNTIQSDRDQFGLTNTNDNNLNVPVQACGAANTNSSAAVAAANALTGVLGDATLANEAGDASSAVECAQESGAGSEVSQTNER